MIECPYCQEMSDTREQLVSHMNDAHTKCSCCGRVFDCLDKETDMALCVNCYARDLIKGRIDRNAKSTTATTGSVPLSAGTG